MRRALTRMLPNLGTSVPSKRQAFFHRHLPLGAVFELGRVGADFVEETAFFPVAAEVIDAGKDGGRHDRDHDCPPDADGAERRVFGEDIGQRESKDPQRNDGQEHRRERVAGTAERASQHLLHADEAEADGQDANEGNAFVDRLASPWA